MTELFTPMSRTESPSYHDIPASWRGVVREETIREFARAVRNFHPAHRREDAAHRLGYSGLVAPPTFATVFLGHLYRELLHSPRTTITAAASRVPHTAPRVLHADHVLDLARPLLAGDRLECRVHVESSRYFSDYEVLTIRSALVDGAGRAVHTGTTTVLGRVRAVTGSGGAEAFADRQQAETALPHTDDRTLCTAVDFDTLAVGDQLPVQLLEVSGADLAEYSYVTGLPSDEPSGMYEIGLATGYLTDWLGDPGAIGRLRTQVAPGVHGLRVRPGQRVRLALRGRITALDRRRRAATLTVDLRCEGRRLFGYAAVEARFR
ncbi:FAS1-like dehydratase domain-containing protein [Nocardia bhagyanarayanae]|uniref:MaoC dehydratase-like protein n=1 Tax=Nocardia bhagyanarayanae TaxID=1215925 RepID=A0A543FHF9_9NOCA|nr:MaoC family dehydratase N-terminal domain-containing protein [Nocardia bhagyanarayanae]TQM33298.1 MaoC dehydratase-like protein [Nocardia bhagyanarayanae]